MENIELVILIVSPFFAALLTSVVGFGSGLILIPIYAKFFPVAEVIGFTSVLFLFTTANKIYFYRKYIRIKEIVAIFFLSLPTVAVGIYFVKNFDNKSLSILIGLYILLVALFDLFKHYRISFNGNIFFIAVFSGFASAVSHGAGPLLTVFFRGKNNNRMNIVASIAVLNFSWNIIKSISYGSVELVPKELIIMVLPFSLPLIFAGTWVGKTILIKYVAEEKFRIVTDLFIIILGIKMLIGR